MKTRSIAEFGDFQTPAALADQVLGLLKELGMSPKSVIEPSCGYGNFLLSALTTFPKTNCFVGADINKAYLEKLSSHLKICNTSSKIQIIHADFFNFEWAGILEELQEPILVIGNPPWVTNSYLSSLNSTNLPNKNNYIGRQGLAALTGKSNFDISEWMILRYIEWLSDKSGAIAVLCKTSVARKVLSHIWKGNANVQDSAIYGIDSAKHFGVSVDACLFIMRFGLSDKARTCRVYDSLTARSRVQDIGFIDGMILSDVRTYNEFRHLKGTNNQFIWRSGIKHDCAKIMELEKVGNQYRNGIGADIKLENNLLYPLLKGSDIANGKIEKCRRYLLVTQSYVGEDTNKISHSYPLTWNYLQSNGHVLDSRPSVIYRNKPKFSIFGVGEYTFSDWKVAVSSLYKKLDFQIVGPIDGKPTVVDDTVYFMSCSSRDEAIFIHSLLTSSEAKSFYESLIFWGDKRPITIDILCRLNLQTLAQELGVEERFLQYSSIDKLPLFSLTK